jgi:hypothetical protein
MAAAVAMTALWRPRHRGGYSIVLATSWRKPRATAALLCRTLAGPAPDTRLLTRSHRRLGRIIAVTSLRRTITLYLSLPAPDTVGTDCEESRLYASREDATESPSPIGPVESCGLIHLPVCEPESEP